MAKSVRDQQLIELKDTISELNKTVALLRDMIELLNRQLAESNQERDNLKQQVDYLTKKLFGRSSEKRKEPIPGQMNLFNEAEDLQDEKAAAAEEEFIKGYKRKRKPKATQAEQFEGLPVETVYLDLPDDQKNCPNCGTPLKEIGSEFVRRKLKFIPAKVTVVEYYSKTYNCPVCEENEEPHIFKGKDFHPHRLHGMGSASAIAWVMYQKYCNAVPLYRQEKDWEQYGVKIGRATLANWIIKNTAECFSPMYDYFRKKLLERRFLMADETPVQVLKEPNRRPESKSYMWIYRTGEDGGVPIIMYRYSETRAGENARRFLEDYDGYLMCDGYSGYNKIKTAKRCSCWAHARRYLVEAVPQGRENDITEPAVQGITYIDKLFRLEKQIRQRHQDPDAVKDARLKKELPVLDSFWSWLDAAMAVKGSRLAKALIYIRNRREDLMRYLEDGRCSFSNNASERSVKPFVIGRKNWLFCDTPDGAVASEMVYTIIETAKASGVNIYHYLCYLLEQCPSNQSSEEELESLAPWNVNVQEEITQRAKGSKQ